MSERAIVVTVGSPKESLGALKLAAWLRRTGWEVERGEGMNRPENWLLEIFKQAAERVSRWPVWKRKEQSEPEELSNAYEEPR